jgi:hypothetical protein
MTTKKRFNASSDNKQESEQLEFQGFLFANKRFTLKNMVDKKFDFLASKLDSLTHQQVVWLSRIEDFFIKTDYITERQSSVVDSIIKQHTEEPNTL